jgi:imidazolonepropionase-like amidohydrolase
MTQRALVLSISLLLWVLPAAAQPTAFVGGTVVNPEGAPIVEDATVVVEDGRITAVGPRADVDVPDDATVIDAGGKYLIPGLTDGHVHFFQSGGLYTRPDAIDLRAVRPYAEELALIKERLPDTFARYLRSGITSVVDVGGPMWNLDVRAQADTMAKAPRVTVAGPLISSVERPKLDEGDPPILKIETPEAARAEVREQVEAGVDLIKIWYIVRPTETPAAYRPVVEATIEEAHRLGKRVAVHATQLETARAAVEAGADILVHSVFSRPVDDAFVQLMHENDVLYTPTIMVMERYSEVFAQQLDLTVPEHQIAHPDIIGSLFDLRTLPDSLMTPGRRRQMQSTRPVNPDSAAIRNLRVLHDAGVPIVAGTDAGNIGTPHGPALHREIELMRAAGLSPREILTTATVGGARLAGRDDLGTIEAGQLADLVILDEDPRTDIAHWSTIHRVVKGGHVFAPDDLVDPSPVHVVQGQLNAYNARDLEGFLSFYAEDVQLFTYPDSLRGQGLNGMRQRYGRLFKQAPQLHAEVTNRMHLGATVIDYERVQGMSADGPVEAIAIYRVIDDVIDRVEFVRR